MAYLIKVTIAWTIFLVLFELLYKNNARFMANRIYLLLSIAAGLLLPLVPWPFPQALNIGAVGNLYSITQSVQSIPGINTPQSVNHIVKSTTGASSDSWDVALIIGTLYSFGALLFLVKYLSELFKIIKLIRKRTAQAYYGHKVINTGKMHSPYSFMNYTFLTDAASLRAKELEYIIQHEAAHNTRKHWLDLWLLQLVSIIFWFHPLVWRYRYLLQLQHEYEADAVAASDDPYHYGRFLLQQTLLRGVPSITHSFHFSPIKNRIHMLTKINGFKSDNRKYLLLIPALLACTFLMAKTNTEVENEIPGNKISFNGNMLTFRQSDTLFYDRVKGKAELVPANSKVKQQVVVGINNEPVYRNDYLQMQAGFGNTSTAFADYIRDEFQKLRKNTADSMTYLIDMNIVVDKDGKVVYYRANYARAESASAQPVWGSFNNWGDRANEFLEKIIADSPQWKPALNDGKPVNSYVTVRFPGC
jgi:beta-lactamase regulating signal transducer with metallopeptidase domain